MEYKGLTKEQVQVLLQKEGPNVIPQQEKHILQKLFLLLVSPISIMLFAASMLSFFTQRDFDGFFILVLLFLNVIITFWQEFKADQAIKKLNQHLLLMVKVLRDNVWVSVSSAELVRGDVVQMSSGQIVPADGKILEAKHVSINEAALTGESLPQEKDTGATVYSGSFLTTGEGVLEITATGPRTYFGKTILSVEKGDKKSFMEQDIIRIAQFLSGISIIAVVILVAVLYVEHTPIAELATLSLSLVIAGIPISLPTVLTLIIEFGVLRLVQKEVVVRRLSALEDLANVNMLLTDKTGTLTENNIIIQSIQTYNDFSEKEVINLSCSTSQRNDHDPINNAILTKAKELEISPDYTVEDYIPADSVRKMATARIEEKGKKTIIHVGAAQKVFALCTSDQSIKTADKDVQELAHKGIRALAIAKSKGNDPNDCTLIGLLGLSDQLRPDTKDVIEFL